MTVRALLCGLSLVVFPANLRAVQEPLDTLRQPGSGLIVIQTADPGVWSMLDGRVLGRGSLKIDSVSAGAHIVKCIPGSIMAWGVPELVDTVSVHAGDTVRVSYPRRGFFLVETIPSGARVMLGDSLLGSTPLMLPASLRGEFGRIALEREGYLRRSLPATPEDGLYLRVILEAGTDGQLSAIDRSGSKFSSTGVVLTGTGALLAGVAAAWLKIKADEKSEEYFLNANPALRSEIDHLDAWGGISLAVCQGLLAYLAYQLLAE